MARSTTVLFSGDAEGFLDGKLETQNNLAISTSKTKAGKQIGLYQKHRTFTT